MSNSAWSFYYILWLQQQQRAKQAEEAKKKAEEEAQRAREEAEQAKQQATEQSKQEQLIQEQPTEEKVEEKPVEEPKQETPVEELKPVETPTTTTTEAPKKSTYVPKPTDCELLYEVGSSDYALCENTKAQNAQFNSNFAIIILLCVAIGVGIASLIVQHVNRSVDEEFKNNKGSGHYWA